MEEKYTTVHVVQPSREKIKALLVTLSASSFKLMLVFILTLSLGGCGILWDIKSPQRSGKSYVIKGQRYHLLASAQGYRARGEASWYGEPFHGRKTASGEVYDMHEITAAHKTLPLQTWVEVRNLDNNKTLVVRINDRGPFKPGRIIDLSREAADKIDMLNSGVAKVSVRAITGQRARRLAEAEQRSTSLAAIPNQTPAAGDF